MINFDDWYEYYEPLIFYIYGEFLNICYNRGINIIDSKEAHDDFAYTLYNTSNNNRIMRRELWPFELTDEEV